LGRELGLALLPTPTTRVLPASASFLNCLLRLRLVIPVIDLFAGPGGLGEGFSSCRSVSNEKFEIAMSVEMEEFAHQTLRLRAFRRQFDVAPAAYWDRLRGVITNDELFGLFPEQFGAADREALRLTLSRDTASAVRDRVAHEVRGLSKWVLVGGPPCQAYSLVGRARNSGNLSYDPNADHRHVLYLEYLQLIADHSPPVFVMENVKGLLSAQYQGSSMFERIRADLERPAEALERTRRSSSSVGRSEYRLYFISPTAGLVPGVESKDFVAKAEEFGVPQARHRVVIVGVRSDLTVRNRSVRRLASVSVEDAICDLPPLSSGLSRSCHSWESFAKEIRRRKWFSGLSSSLRDEIERALSVLESTPADRGGEFVPGSNSACEPLGGWTHHETRSHMESDLERYLFASSFAAVAGRSPSLLDFPVSLLPRHENIDQALSTGHFADRFRVQVAGRPASTITSHISKDGHYYIHPDSSQCRSLTVREAARLQTFPDDYFFCGPRTAQFQQVGNAVPPLFARAIASRVLHVLLDNFAH